MNPQMIENFIRCFRQEGVEMTHNETTVTLRHKTSGRVTVVRNRFKDVDAELQKFEAARGYGMLNSVEIDPAQK